MKQAKTLLPPRERILAAARELFYRDGIRAVGVDAIAAAAGTNKMTLYRHFDSKDALVSAYLEQLSAEGEALWDEARGSLISFATASKQPDLPSRSSAINEFREVTETADTR